MVQRAIQSVNWPMAASVCEITWGLWDGALVAECADRDEMLEFIDRADLDAWAREHCLTTHPWVERIRVVRAVSAPPTEEW